MTVLPETRYLHLGQPFTLESGATLPEVTVAYRTWGLLAAGGDNAVLVCHALTGSADVDSWWPALLGPGRALDTERDFIICSNVLGSCYGTTGPTSPRPDSDGAWGVDFPGVTVRDMVRLQRLLARELGVRHLALVIGGSLGGMQALEWIATFPELVGAAVVIAAPARHSAWATALGAAQRAAIEADARFRGGRYPQADPPRDGLAAARMIAMCSYRSPASLGVRFGRERASDGRFAVERYLRHHGDRLVARFDANAYLTLIAAMDSHDVARGRGELAGVLHAVRVPTLVVGIASDVLYPPAEVEELARALPHATFELLDSPHGHDAFLIEGEAVSRRVASFRASLRAPRRAAPAAPGGARVLKFGGTSLADAARLRQVAALVASGAREGRLAVVVSALAGVTDALARLADRAAAGRPWRPGLAALEMRHRTCAAQLGAGATADEALAVVVDDAAKALGAIEQARSGIPALADEVLACGERLALVLALQALRAADVEAVAWDTRRLIVTNDGFGAAAVDAAATACRIAAAWGSLPPGAVPVATGYIAADRHGRTTTLGRGGSDYSASLLGAALAADRVEIWTDVDGVLSAPPGFGIAGHTVPRLSYTEAAELARWGGKVLHPATTEPVARLGIPVSVHNTFRPGGPCTLVSGAAGAGGVQAVSALPGDGVVAVVGTGIAHLALALQHTLVQAGIGVLASIATGSAHSLAVEVSVADVPAAVAVLHEALVAPRMTAGEPQIAAGGGS